jgi:hypothetical protein
LDLEAFPGKLQLIGDEEKSFESSTAEPRVIKLYFVKPTLLSDDSVYCWHAFSALSYICE